MIRFQSTLLQEERRFTASWFLVKDGISIHAPTRGATQMDEQRLMKIKLFQSTLLQEERRYIRSLSRGLLYHFNPRSYKRSDMAQNTCALQNTIFQSTLLQEERLFQTIHSLKLIRISIHAPTRGATMQNKRLQSFCKFQSTLLQEERRIGGF